MKHHAVSFAIVSLRLAFAVAQTAASPVATPRTYSSDANFDTLDVHYTRTAAKARQGLERMRPWDNDGDRIRSLSPAHGRGARQHALSAPQAVTLGGIIHPGSDDTPAFTPDGHTVFFDRSSGPRKSIMVSDRVNGHWSKPRVASFSGHWHDQNPVVAPDGSYMLFDSDRPVTPGGKPLVQSYFGRTAPGANIWRVERKGDGWGSPVWLGPVVNNDVFIDFPSVAADGTLYFIRYDSSAKVMHTWRSQYRHGTYLAPRRAGLGDRAVSTHDPAVAPDQSFIVFDYGKVKGGLGRLCIAFRVGDHWGRPIDLGEAVNKDKPWGPRIAPDGHTVYFTGSTGIVWRFSLAPWLKQAAASAPNPF